jgi:transcriptional regulator GlxA family with amidase domain
MDQLSKILKNLSFNADVFFSGNLCGIQSLGGSDSKKGHLHLLRTGLLTMVCEEGHKVTLDKPSVIFMPSSTKHQVIASESSQAELVCVDIDFHCGSGTALVNALPKLICLDIEKNGSLGKTAHWLFDEAFNSQPGQQIIVNKLGDIFLVQILRHILHNGIVVQGMLSGMAHPQLSTLMTAIHEKPEEPWTVDLMAEKALMSRAKFAALFRETVGQAPSDYLTDLRIALAQGLLKKDLPVSLVANEVGYEHGSALARVFRKKMGVSPKEWLMKLRK